MVLILLFKLLELICIQERDNLNIEELEGEYEGVVITRFYDSEKVFKEDCILRLVLIDSSKFIVTSYYKPGLEIINEYELSISHASSDSMFMNLFTKNDYVDYDGRYKEFVDTLNYFVYLDSTIVLNILISGEIEGYGKTEYLEKYICKK
jgi:hypothetical protein